jgi:glutamate racemase
MQRPVDPLRPILFLDSGLGGFSILEPVRAAIPHMSFVYAADFAGIPYGEKSEIEVATRVCALLGSLSAIFRPRLAVIACNTASTIALGHVRAVLNLPIVGTVPAIKPAAELSRSRTIGVLGTAATIRQPYVDRLSADHAADCTVLRHAAPDLVRAAEAKLRGAPFDPAVIPAALDGLRHQPGGDRLDTVVLACTHFPLLRDELEAEAPNLTFVDGGAGIARRVVHLTSGQDWAKSQNHGVFLHTENPDYPPPPPERLIPFGFGTTSVI